MTRMEYINFLYDKGMFNSSFTLCRMMEMYKHHETGKVIKFLRKSASYLLRTVPAEELSAYGYSFLSRLKRRKWITLLLQGTIEEQRRFFFSRVIYQLLLLCKPLAKQVQGWIATEMIKTIK